MTTAEAYAAFYTLLLGLGMAAMLTGLADVIRRKEVREIGLPGGLLLVLILFEFLTGWIAAPGSLATNNAISSGSLVLPFLTGSCYFLAAVLLFPDAEARERGGLRAYIADQTRIIALLLMVANACLVLAETDYAIDQFVNRNARFWAVYLPFNATILLAYGVVALWPRRRIATIAMAVLLVVYTLFTLGVQTIFFPR